VELDTRWIERIDNADDLATLTEDLAALVKYARAVRDCRRAELAGAGDLRQRRALVTSTAEHVPPVIEWGV
jgi:hypothetical protein